MLEPHTINELNVGGLKVYHVTNSIILPSNGKPLGLFVLHGRKGSALQFIEKELSFLKSLLTLLAPTWTVHLFCLDQRNHGERLLDKEQNLGKENPHHARDMYAIQLGTAWDVDYLSRVLPTWGIEGFGTGAVFGVLGFSLGGKAAPFTAGHACLLSLANSSEISFGISVVGCGLSPSLILGDYLKLMESRGLAGLPSELVSLVQIHDPIENLDRLAKKDVLLLGGEHDHLVPPWTNLLFVQRLESVRKPAGSIQVMNDPDAKHEFSIWMKDRISQYLLDLLL
ncbi:hypothetical protein HDU91_005289 [Kappamyces sp. JEL0680]|nr:hypothetical protein HDU91_005289 [Kappamyces sp. JEL0680]